MADWDKRYTDAETRLFGDAPNEYLREVTARSDFRAESALMIADGDGRNGAWLAAQGIAVTATDISAVATEQAHIHDEALGVSVERIVADLADWEPETGRTWDAVFMFYLQCEAEVRKRAISVAARTVTADGWFAAEGFAPAPDGRSALGPNDEMLLYDLEALIDALPDFHIIEALTGWVRLDEGVKHRGHGYVARLLARRGPP